MRRDGRRRTCETGSTGTWRPAGEPVELRIGDTVRLRKKHPCGSYEWEITRLGADIGIKCRGCGRRVLIPRGDLERRIKAIVQQGKQPRSSSLD